MPGSVGSSLAGIITATTGVIALITAIIVLIPLLLGLRRNLSSVHKIVNQQRTDMLRYQRALVHALTEAGMTVPLDQSNFDEGVEDDARTSPAVGEAGA